MPMPNEVINWVHHMAWQECTTWGLLFEDHDHNKLLDPNDDGEDDESFNPDLNNEDDDDDANDRDDCGGGGNMIVGNQTTNDEEPSINYYQGPVRIDQ